MQWKCSSTCPHSLATSLSSLDHPTDMINTMLQTCSYQAMYYFNTQTACATILLLVTNTQSEPTLASAILVVPGAFQQLQTVTAIHLVLSSEHVHATVRACSRPHTPIEIPKHSGCHHVGSMYFLATHHTVVLIMKPS